MTRNPKPDDLPGDLTIEDLNTDEARELVVDLYLSREAVIERIAERTPAELGCDPSTGRLTHLELARLYREHGDVTDAQDRDPKQIRTRLPKYAIIQRLGDVFGFDAEDARRQDVLRKSQLVHILTVLATGDEPESFTLPSDPDDHNGRIDAASPAGD